jgi:uncharacterized RDD family membrane protein YckC
MTTEQTSAELLNFDDSYARASTGKRLANYLIDVVVFYFLLIPLGFAVALLSPTTIENLTDDNAGFGFLDRIFSLLLYAFYMSAIEAIFKGKSIGKLITKTRAINLDGTKISASTAFARGFSRAVPFCVFSAFGNPCNPWHDRWTNTMVVDEDKLSAQ